MMEEGETKEKWRNKRRKGRKTRRNGENRGGKDKEK